MDDIVIRIILISYSIIVIYPMLWTALTSLKTNREFYQNPWKLPTSLQLSNYARAWVQASFSRYFFNSIVVTVIPLIVTLVLAATTAYVLARFKFRGNGLITNLYLAGLMVPGILTIIPTFFLLNAFRLLDSLLGLIAVYVSRTLPFSLFVLIGFFKTLPKELEEAAMIDGCSYSATFWRIMFPLAKPGLITVTIFNFLWYWNEFAFALTYISSGHKKTLPVGMATLMEVARYRTDWGALFAGLMLIMLPTLCFYIIFQREIIKGLTAGALKG